MTKKLRLGCLISEESKQSFFFFFYIAVSALNFLSLAIRMSLQLLVSWEGTFHTGDLFSAFRETKNGQGVLFAPVIS